jgi:hypothetical protein
MYAYQVAEPGKPLAAYPVARTILVADG